MSVSFVTDAPGATSPWLGPMVIFLKADEASSCRNFPNDLRAIAWSSGAVKYYTSTINIDLDKDLARTPGLMTGASPIWFDRSDTFPLERGAMTAAVKDM
jgi:hypothetical protein